MSNENLVPEDGGVLDDLIPKKKDNNLPIDADDDFLKVDITVNGKKLSASVRKTLLIENFEDPRFDDTDLEHHLQRLAFMIQAFRTALAEQVRNRRILDMDMDEWVAEHRAECQQKVLDARATMGYIGTKGAPKQITKEDTHAEIVRLPGYREKMLEIIEAKRVEEILADMIDSFVSNGMHLMSIQKRRTALINAGIN